MAAGTEQRQSVPRTKAWAFNTHLSQEAHLVSASWGGANSHLGSNWQKAGLWHQDSGTGVQLLRLVCTSRGNTDKEKKYFSHLLGLPDLWEEKNQRK